MKSLIKIGLLSLFFAVFCISGSYAQVTIGADQEPDVDAVLELISADKGLLLPRVKLKDASKADPLSDHKAGMVVYNIGDFEGGSEPGPSEVSSPNKSTLDDETYLPQGYYYNDGFQWVQITDTNIAAWRSVATKNAATSNTESIYQTGAVLVGGSGLEAHTQFAVISQTKGALMPRMTTSQRNAIGEGSADPIPDGLLIYNTSTKCFNYFNSNTDTDGGWVSVCGDLDPAKFELEDCTSIVTPIDGASGDYVAGEPLSASTHTYSINVRVNEIGTYTILLTTGNGYSFYKSGVFTQPGEAKVILEGQGTPIRSSLVSGDTPILQFNGQTIDMSNSNCPTGLTKIFVRGSDVTYTIDPASCTALSNGTAVHGNYKRGVVMNAADNYVTLTINVIDPGKTTIEATPTGLNGITFRSDVLDLAAGANTIQLKASGTPVANGTFTYSVSDIPSSGSPVSCTFSITVSSDIGSFTNPAKNCLEIYNAYPSGSKPINGEYWIQQRSGSSAAVKTFCDMGRASVSDPENDANAGWTLLWSFSELTLQNSFVPIGRMSMYTSGMYLSANKERGTSSLKADGATIGTTGLYDYRLSGPTMQNVKQNASSPSEYKIRIAEDPADMDDAWGAENYVIVRPANTAYDYLASTAGNSYTWVNGTTAPFEGKIFGLEYRSGTGNEICYGGTCQTGNRGALYYGRTPYVQHWDFGPGRMPGGTKTATISVNGGERKGGSTTSITINATGHFNNVFGCISEYDISHHIGKCNNEADYSNPTYCLYTLKSPHSMNGGQGRVMQWWVR